MKSAAEPRSRERRGEIPGHFPGGTQNSWRYSENVRGARAKGADGGVVNGTGKGVEQRIGKRIGSSKLRPTPGKE